MDRVRRRPRLFGPSRRGTSPLRTGTFGIALALAAAALCGPAWAGAAPLRGGPTSPDSSSPPAAVRLVARGAPPSAADPALALASQTPWVTPAQPTFDLHLQVAGGSRPLAQLGLTVEVYPCLSSISGFDQSVSGAGPEGGPMTTTTQPVPLAGLPTVAPGIVDLSMPVTVEGSPAAGAPFTIDLTPTSGECQAFPSGVFPVRVSLVDVAAGATLSSLVTHLVFSEEAAAAHKLRVAVVVPVQLGLDAAPATAGELAVRPSAALQAPSAAQLTALSGVASALATHPGVPVTVALSGQALQALSAAGRQPVLDQLSEVTQPGAADQVLAAPFVPVDATALVDGGLTSELAEQVARGAQVAAPVTHQTSNAQGPGGLGTWVATSGLDESTVAALSDVGYREVVLPPSAVAQAPSNGSAAEPFTVVGSRGAQLSAVATDSDLTARFAAASTDPVLAAHQLVAEAAQIFFEKPNDDTPRGVVAVPPSDWTVSPAFVDALLSALDGNPVLQASTVTDLVAAVPAAPDCRAGCRLAPASSSSLPAAAVRQQRHRITAFSTAVRGAAARAVVSALGDLVLAGQSDLLHPSQQSAVVAGSGRALDAQLQRVAVTGGQVTLTSRQGTLPVTITSTAPYEVDVSLTLSSDKLQFPGGGTTWTRPGTVVLLPAPHTTVVNVPVKARGSGLFPVAVVLRSPSGGLQVASGSIDIRSTAASVVGVVLSAGAIVVLAAWWFRTSRRRRAARRHEDSEEQPKVPVGVP